MPRNPPETVAVTFHNVMITIEAKTPEEAYTILANTLWKDTIEWTSDTYSVEAEPMKRKTEELWPKF